MRVTNGYVRLHIEPGDRADFSIDATGPVLVCGEAFLRGDLPDLEVWLSDALAQVVAARRLAV